MRYRLGIFHSDDIGFTSDKRMVVGWVQYRLVDGEILLANTVAAAL